MKKEERKKKGRKERERKAWLQLILSRLCRPTAEKQIFFVA